MHTKPAASSQTSFLKPTLGEQLDSRQPLKQLADTLPWSEFAQAFGKYYSAEGRPAKPVRLMVGLLFGFHCSISSDIFIDTKIFLLPWPMARRGFGTRWAVVGRRRISCRTFTAPASISGTWARRCIPGTKRRAGNGWKRGCIGCATGRNGRCCGSWRRCRASEAQSGKRSGGNKTTLLTKPGACTTKRWRVRVGRSAAAGWNRRADPAKAGARAADSFGRARGCAIWTP